MFPSSNKKADVVENPQVLDHAGLLFDGPPAKFGAALRLVVRHIQIIPESRRGTATTTPKNIIHVARLGVRRQAQSQNRSQKGLANCTASFSPDCPYFWLFVRSIRSDSRQANPANLCKRKAFPRSPYSLSALNRGDPDRATNVAFLPAEANSQEVLDQLSSECRTDDPNIQPGGQVGPCRARTGRAG